MNIQQKFKSKIRLSFALWFSWPQCQFFTEIFCPVNSNNSVQLSRSQAYFPDHSILFLSSYPSPGSAPDTYRQRDIYSIWPASCQLMCYLQSPWFHLHDFQPSWEAQLQTECWRHPRHHHLGQRSFWNKPMGNPGISSMVKCGSRILLRAAGTCWCLLGMWGWSLWKEWTAITHCPRQSRAPSSLREPDSWGKRGWKQKGRQGEGFGRLIKKSDTDPLYLRSVHPGHSPTGALNLAPLGSREISDTSNLRQ